MLNHLNFITAYVRARFGDTEKGASLVEYACSWPSSPSSASRR